MLDGWYCRTLANEQAAVQPQNHTLNDDAMEDVGETDESQEGQENFNNTRMTTTANHVDYKSQAKYLKGKLKFLIYENEFFQDALRSNQRRLLKVSRDRSFLLDRLLQYEKPEITSSESEDTESSEDEAAKEPKRKKMEQVTPVAASGRGRKRKNIPSSHMSEKEKIATATTVLKLSDITVHQGKNSAHPSPLEGHMTAEEVERHLQSRQSITELVPERAPPTVPNEMFSNEPSLDSESNDQIIETSPSNIGDECLSVETNNQN